MHTIVGLLLAVTKSEERSFWLLLATVDLLLPIDFHGKTSASSMNGLLTFSSLAVEIMRNAASRNSVGVEARAMSLQMLAPKMLIPLFADEIPVECTLSIWDRFFVRGDDRVRGKELLVSLLALESMSPVVSSATEHYSNCLKLFRKLNTEKFRSVTEVMRSHVKDDDRLEATYLRLTRELARKWGSTKLVLRKLARDESVHFTVEELEELQSSFLKMEGSGRTGLDADQTTRLLKRLGVAEDLARMIFDTCDDDRSKSIDFRELVCILSTLSRGSYQARLEMAFRAFDADQSGLLDRTEILSLSKTLARSWRTTGASVEDEDAHASNLFEKFMISDADGDAKISLDEFCASVRSDPCLSCVFEMMGSLSSSMSNDSGASVKQRCRSSIAGFEGKEADHALMTVMRSESERSARATMKKSHVRADYGPANEACACRSACAIQ